MKVLFIHNEYGKFSGEESVAGAQMELLREHGHEVFYYSKSSRTLGTGLSGKLSAFFTGLYNPGTIREIKRIIKTFQPEVVHVHNLYPIISPAVLPVLTKAGLPVVMTVHNFRLVCPNGLFYTRGEICERCSGPGKELNCIKYNCEQNTFKSIGYALRNFWARVNGYYLRNVNVFACLTEFQRTKLVESGVLKSRTVVLPNFLNEDGEDELPAKIDYSTVKSPYVAFAGRLNRQKGFDLLCKAMDLNAGISLKAAGDADKDFLRGVNVPVNIRPMGKLNKVQMSTFWSGARFLVFTSASYEGFPVVFLEAMQYHLPVIAPKLGAFPEIIEDGYNGLLYEAGNFRDLADKIRQLWENKPLCARLGENGFLKLQEKYSSELYYSGLMNLYSSLAHKIK